MSGKDDKSGSAGAGVAAAPPAAADGAGKEARIDNKSAKLTMDSVMAKNVALEKANTEKDLVISDLTKHLKEANDVLDGQEKARLISEILPKSAFKVDELSCKSVEELKSIRATLDFAVPPRANSVRFGVPAVDISDREKGLTVGDLSYVTEQKRKAAAGAA